MCVSDIAKKITPIMAREMFDCSRKYDNVIDLTIGDPDFVTPSVICDAGCAAIRQGRTNYTANNGVPELRQAIVDDAYKQLQIKYNPESQVIVTVGAMGALYLLIKSYINVGDEVLILEPCWTNYGQMVQMSGGCPVFVETDQRDFSVSKEKLVNKITHRTKMIIINSPNNPTGNVLSLQELQIVADVAREYNLLVVSDEVYSSIVFDNKKYDSIVMLKGMKRQTIVINSCSKRYAMTGWRVGYALGDEKIIAAMTRLQENVVACCPQPSQYAAIEALSCDQECVKKMVSEYENRRNFFVSEIKKMNGLSCLLPKGTFYVWVDISELDKQSQEFAIELLERYQVAIVPGSTYGEMGEGYVRVALTQPIYILKEALFRIDKYINEI